MVPEALGELVLPVEEAVLPTEEPPAEAEPLAGVPFEPEAMAAAWKAWNVFAADGFTANTMPFSQCPVCL